MHEYRLTLLICWQQRLLHHHEVLLLLGLLRQVLLWGRGSARRRSQKYLLTVLGLIHRISRRSHADVLEGDRSTKLLRYQIEDL